MLKVNLFWATRRSDLTPLSMTPLSTDEELTNDIAVELVGYIAAAGLMGKGKRFKVMLGDGYQYPATPDQIVPFAE